MGIQESSMDESSHHCQSCPFCMGQLQTSRVSLLTNLPPKVSCRSELSFLYRTAADIPGQSTDQLTLKVPGLSCPFCAIGMLVHQKEYVQRQPWTGDIYVPSQVCWESLLKIWCTRFKSLFQSRSNGQRRKVLGAPLVHSKDAVLQMCSCSRLRPNPPWFHQDRMPVVTSTDL